MKIKINDIDYTVDMENFDDFSTKNETWLNFYVENEEYKKHFFLFQYVHYKCDAEAIESVGIYTLIDEEDETYDAQWVDYETFKGRFVMSGLKLAEVRKTIKMKGDKTHETL